jgi:hypothetical protein
MLAPILLTVLVALVVALARANLRLERSAVRPTPVRADDRRADLP